MDNKIIDLITTFATINKTAVVNYLEFLKYAENYAYNNNLPDIIHQIRDQKLEIIPTLMQWEYKGYGTLFRKEGNVESILIHSIIEDMIRVLYTQIENYAELAFPDEAYFGVTLPERMVAALEVRAEFVNFLESIDTYKQPIIKLTFPNGIRPVLVTRDVVKTRLVECALLKLGRYLQYKMNSGYIHSRLETVLSGSLEALKGTISDIVTKPKKALQQLFEADDFTFRFWSQFTNIILKDYRDKKDKSEEEIGFCQSAHVIGLFIGYQKSIIQRENQREMDFHVLEKLVKKPPYAFTVRDLYMLKDPKGAKYIDKYSREFIHEFLRRVTKVTDSTKLPYLIRIKLDEAHDYFIQKDIIIPVFVNSLTDSRRILEQEYKDEWQTLLRNNTQLPTMIQDSEFLNDLTARVRRHFPIIIALSNPHLLYVVKEESNISEENKLSVDRCFSKKNTLKPLTELLDIHRSSLLHDVKMLLPVWYTLPVLKQLFFLFRWFLGKGNRGFRAKALRLWQDVKTEWKRGADKDYAKLISTKKEEEAEEEKAESQKVMGNREQLAQYRDAVIKTREQIIGKNADLDSTLAELAEKWNPLYDDEAKANLVEDVNCFVRDYLRQIKRTYKMKPPTTEQIRGFSSHLVANKNLKDIRKKETLRTYIEAYMVRVLEETYKIR